MKYDSSEDRICFSPAIEALRKATFARAKPNRVREGTRTGPDPDGKTPFLDVFERMPDAPYAVCLAHGIVDSWLESPIIIDPTDLLVGAPRPLRVLFEHFSWGIQYHEELFDDPAYAPQRESIQARIEKQANRLFPLTKEHIRSEGIEIFVSEELYDSLDSSLWWVGGYQGHTVPSYPELLKLGLSGTMAKIERYRAEHPDAETLYDALEILLKGMSRWILLYAEESEKLASIDPQHAARYRLIAKNCRDISWNAPRTLFQAAQLAWFYALWDWVDCIGRADQFFYPFYSAEADPAVPFSREEIIQAFWLRGFEHGFHNITLSGVHSDGSDATNELTYLMLQTCRALHETHPRVSVRIHENSPAELLALVVRMWSEGMSDPTVVSDANVLKGLNRLNIPIEDARDYCMLGCQEIEIPGRSNWGCEDGSFNLAKIFELAANDGKCRKTGRQIGLKTGKLVDFHSIDELWDAYIAQMKFFTKHFIDLCNRGVEIRDVNLSKLVKMLYTLPCIERGLNPDAGGPLYNPGVVETAGSSAVADSFTAIDTVVFRQHRMTMETLDKALAANFKGYERERLLLLNAPKFGNDHPLADQYCRRVLDAFWDEIALYRSKRGGPFTGACSLLEAGITYGKNTWAMPDGRYAGEPLGNSIGPRTGADHNGLTAMLNSVSSLPLDKGVGGATLNVLLPAELLKSEPLRRDIAQVIRSYLMNGGQMAQITTASREEMLDAKVHPERHGDLIVRIGGFSIRFVELGETSQDEIIARYA